MPCIKTSGQVSEWDESAFRRMIQSRDRQGGYRWMKRGFDFAAAACALVVLLPLLLVLAGVIWLDDPGGSPVFTQLRVGRDGKTFRLFKFRTMVVDAEQLFEMVKDQNEADGPAFKMKNDPRVTKIGRFLRRSGLDELPQLLNILRGEMSFVGPRPPLPREVEAYTDYERLRLLVKPGLTCYWQTERDRNDISFERWVALDLKYIRERSIWLDLKLILKTGVAVVRGDGR